MGKRHTPHRTFQFGTYETSGLRWMDLDDRVLL